MYVGKRKDPTELWSQGNQNRVLFNDPSFVFVGRSNLGGHLCLRTLEQYLPLVFQVRPRMSAHISITKSREIKRWTRGESLSGQQTFLVPCESRTKGGHCVAERQKKACVEKGV
ncbi:hypothetical protein CEXT_714241 [Caerostris extrusa]|uniref:Uncharacterized protein n=1 Tax=Caerostris extrusa TaxID=172846 RepID=A0AAV4N3G5_CAEEX|nr:hypothetical protein CEXT_714241 [Caerostris extrusa]